MSWRPEGWRNPHIDALAKEIGHADSPYEAVFEAGADAMLELLKEQGVYGKITVRHGTMQFYSQYASMDTPYIMGWAIYIPEEQP